MEDYVTFEQAVKLKELGFDWYNRHTQMYYATQCYCEGNNPFFFDTIGPGDLISSPKMKEDENDGWIEDEDYCVLAPTMSQVAKWLREKHNLYIHVYLHLDDCWRFEIEDINDIDKYIFEPEVGLWWRSYEDALSAGIDKALELLK